jgi:hypothetical protein
MLRNPSYQLTAENFPKKALSYQLLAISYGRSS